MKKVKNIRIILLVILSIVLLGCNKKDDDHIDNDPKGGADHIYELKYIGGIHDGETITSSIVNNNTGAVYSDVPTLQSIVIVLTDESQDRKIAVGINREDGDNNIEINNPGEDEQGAGITISNQEFTEVYGSETGTLTISNFQTYPSPLGNTGLASLTVNFTGQFIEIPSGEIVQITGKITISPPRL